MQEFQCFLKRLQYGIKYGIRNRFGYNWYQEGIEIDFNAREVKIEIPTTFEIKVVLITFVIKNEIEKLEEMEIMQEKPKLI